MLASLIWRGDSIRAPWWRRPVYNFKIQGTPANNAARCRTKAMRRRRTTRDHGTTVVGRLPENAFQI
eukprot:10108420-Lingulodinium_polyedra.AAC.1